MLQRTKSQKIFGGVLMGLAVGLILLVAQSARAVNIRVSLEPAVDANGIARNVFDLIAEPNSTIKDEAVIRNSTEEAIKAYIFASGFEVRDGKVQPVIAPAETEPDPGTWITLSTSELIIPANGIARVKFSIKVPEHLDVGEHQATLFVQGQSLTAPTTNASGFNIIIRNGVRVYMVVPGQIDRTLLTKKIRHRIEPLWSFLNRKLYFAIDFENKGNITLRPKTNIKVRGLFGTVGEMKDVEFIKIARGTSQTGEALWNRRPPLFGRFVATFEIHLGEKEQVNEDRTRTMLPDQVINARYVFWIFPWIYLLYIIGLAFILYLLRAIFLYFVITNRLKIKADIYTVKTGDTLMKIASKLGVDPTVLAKFNFLAWPYHLQSGDQILIPTGRMTHFEWRNQARGLLGSKVFFGGILGHLFNPKAVRHISGRLNQHSQSDLKVVNPKSSDEVLVVERGDTIHDVADFAGVSVQLIAKYNHLKSPYRLRTGQELKIPRQSSKSKRR